MLLPTKVRLILEVLRCEHICKHDDDKDRVCGTAESLLPIELTIVWTGKEYISGQLQSENKYFHDDVIKWKHFPRNWPFVREIHRSPVNFPHKGQWRGALMFSLIYAWINDWVNNREAGDLRRQHGHYDVIVMSPAQHICIGKSHLPRIAVCVLETSIC